MEPGQPCVMISGLAFVFGRANMDEMDAETINIAAELIKGIDARFSFSPVVLILPVVEQFRDVGERDSLRPIIRGFGFGEPGAFEPIGEIFKLGITGCDAEWVNGHTCRVE